ncbi:unnamed protein product [Staurois parvus]|uniref:Uncharacterized protein n=1 Tax=Staurois parvus TaxID=386267 RepID=A0ABN9BIB4_9NEOB|nr:unnamed protein product [Staurois parvus]
MSLLQLSNFPPVRPDVAGDGTRKTDAGMGRRTLPGSAGKGK